MALSIYPSPLQGQWKDEWQECQPLTQGDCERQQQEKGRIDKIPNTTRPSPRSKSNSKFRTDNQNPVSFASAFRFRPTAPISFPLQACWWLRGLTGVWLPDIDGPGDVHLLTPGHLQSTGIECSFLFDPEIFLLFGSERYLEDLFKGMWRVINRSCAIQEEIRRDANEGRE